MLVLTARISTAQDTITYIKYLLLHAIVYKYFYAQFVTYYFCNYHYDQSLSLNGVLKVKSNLLTVNEWWLCGKIFNLCRELTINEYSLTVK